MLKSKANPKILMIDGQQMTSLKAKGEKGERAKANL